MHTVGTNPAAPLRFRFNAVCGGLILALAIGLMCSVSGRSQQSSSENGMPIPDQNTPRGAFARPVRDANSVVDEYAPMMTERRIRALNIERQKQMVSDATKLLKLAKELNDELANTGTGTFSAEQLRKIGEIEKLARSVRERSSR
jgi:hypothetical protein